VVAVGPHQFGTREFERARARRVAALQQRLGDQFDPRALADTIDQLAARELVERGLLAMEAEALGLSVSKQEIEANVLADPGFRDDSGRFDQEAFEGYTEYEYGSQRAFIEDRRLGLLALKMVRLLQTQPRVSEGEVRQAVLSQLESVRIAFVALAGGEPDLEAIAAEEVATAIEERGEEVRALYDGRSDEFNLAEAVRARHILFAAGGDDAASEAALESAETALERIRAGEEFTALASELSEDVGSKDKGGDLGFFERGQMVPPFEEAAFALEPGQLSEPVKSAFGYHIIQVEEHRAAVHRPFEEVQDQLARELLGSDVARRESAETAEELASAVRDGTSLEEAARSLDLTLERSGLLTRRLDGFVPGLGPMPELLATAFSLEPGESSPRIFEREGTHALVQLLERVEPDPKLVEQDLEQTRTELLQSKRIARADAWLNARREELVAGGNLVVDLTPSGRR
jgi:peptidyl-prolyl cis-trans isomerase D